MSVILAYRRKSVVQNAADLISPEQQAHACQQWLALYLPDSAIEWFEDIDRSGRTEEGRPGWRALLAQLDRPGVAGVMAWSLDRMYRNVGQFLAFLDRLERGGQRLITVKENLDTASATGRAVVTILMAIAQLESDQASERSKTVVGYRREVLGHYWGATPWGCDRNAAGLLVPTEAVYWLNPHTGEASATERDGWERRRYYDALLYLYRRYASDDTSLKRLAAELNAAGWRRHGRDREPVPFDHSDVRRALALWQLYRGDVTVGQAILRRGDEPAYPGAHGPILPPELCDQVAAVRQKRRDYHSRFEHREGRARVFYLLSGLIHCAGCGRKLSGSHSPGERRLYRHAAPLDGCTERPVTADDIERQVVDWIIELVNDNFLDDLQAEAEQLARQATAGDDSRRLLAELERQRERLTKLEDLYLDDGIDRDRYNRRRAEIAQGIAGLERELYAAATGPDVGAMIDGIRDTLAQIHDATPERRRELVRAVFRRVDVAGGQVVGVEPMPWAAGLFP